MEPYMNIAVSILVVIFAVHYANKAAKIPTSTSLVETIITRS
jgi:hypothetical protein